MKKQFLILVTTITSFVIISCSKDKTEMEPVTQNTNQQTDVSNAAKERLVVDPLLVSLQGRYEFNGNLKDATRKLSDGIPSLLLRGIPIYTYDRKGIANSALKFDGSYYVSIHNVPVQQNMSLSLWVKRTATYPSNAPPSIVRHNSTGISVMQDEDAFWGRVLSYTISESSSLISDPFNDEAWHHIVITYSADAMIMYVDGQWQGKTSDVYTVPDVITKYLLGYAHGQTGKYWKGYIDDLRFYGRTHSASDAQKLYNL